MGRELLLKISVDETPKFSAGAILVLAGNAPRRKRGCDWRLAGVICKTEWRRLTGVTRAGDWAARILARQRKILALRAREQHAKQAVPGEHTDLLAQLVAVKREDRLDRRRLDEYIEESGLPPSDGVAFVDADADYLKFVEPRK